MNKVWAIKTINPDPFLITWDLGRRCNYDCSYCPVHRHDNFSPHASLDELKSATRFLFDYISLIATHRHNKDFNISFTGGEPTVNPNFIEFAKYINNEKSKYPFNIYLDLTTNGAMGEKIADAVIENFDFVTVSYHCEAHDNLKKQALKRIDDFAQAGTNLKVNVMFHAKYFDECKQLCEQFKSNNIRFIPRVIGDDPDSKSSQAHLYTEEQKQWFKEYWGIEEPSKTMRPCCGGRTLGLCTSQGVEQSKVVNSREFQGWSCSVNWFFLHIEQQSGLVYHHQTCQARLDGTRGHIGTLSDSRAIITQLQNYLTTKTMPTIVCPNKLCGCGLCTPKSEQRQDYYEIIKDVIDVEILNDF